MLSGQGSTLFSGVNAMIGILSAIQLWLVAASLEALYSNDVVTPQAAFVASCVLALVNALLCRHALSFDRRRQEERRRASSPRRDRRVGAS
ncbi:DUF6755 family protein [Polyangium jinanense]|uniref:Uncharacterized protein n=1 Tax=Polyangium jinanense TaxID=2829994 RepID=A0A9X3XGN6_9BACT|nr:DUF6755 family protein [Polyangium jinanense]MDC3962085.1 hypothetical protein [Polyangium jinanense]MDC3988368.1 hypothetical protein [Polyangium jinanense]